MNKDMIYKVKKSDVVVEFVGLTRGKILYKDGNWIDNPTIEGGFAEYTDTDVWEKVTNNKGIMLEPIPDEPIPDERNKVKNPNSTHYELWNGFEAIDVIKLSLTPEEYRGFLKGNILKYQLRLGKKDNVDKEIVKIKDYQSELNESITSPSK